MRKESVLKLCIIMGEAMNLSLKVSNNLHNKGTSPLRMTKRFETPFLIHELNTARIIMFVT